MPDDGDNATTSVTNATTDDAAPTDDATSTKDAADNATPMKDAAPKKDEKKTPTKGGNGGAAKGPSPGKVGDTINNNDKKKKDDKANPNAELMDSLEKMVKAGNSASTDLLFGKENVQWAKENPFTAAKMAAGKVLGAPGAIVKGLSSLASKGSSAENDGKEDTNEKKTTDTNDEASEKMSNLSDDLQDPDMSTLSNSQDTNSTITQAGEKAGILDENVNSNDDSKENNLVEGDDDDNNSTMSFNQSS
jgi:hypothetical protein